MSVAAVKTTGIYCRPACGASPKRDNVECYPLPASAEAAGYRACLRCRPYRLSQTLGWDAPELVCRAVRLIVSGALDDGTEAELGRRLGISSRHLRRLFVSELGVTPDGLARSARVHFARRLLDDTDLTVTEIAFAAGFRSVRQFNRACRDVFRAAPSELRARRRRADRLSADGGLPLRLSYSGSLDWSALLVHLAAHATPGVESIEDGCYRRTVVIDGDPGVIELQRGSGDELILVAHLPHWEELIHVVGRVRQLANLDRDPPGSALADDPVVGALRAARPFVRPPGAWDGFETAVRALIGRHLNRADAIAEAGRFAECFGTPVAGLGTLGLTHTFPGPTALAGADIRAVGLNSADSRTIVALAKAVSSRGLSFEGMALEQILVELGQVDGFDPSTAHYVALRLGERDAWPREDPTLRRAAIRIAPTVELDAAAERWRPWRALGATHLWLANDSGRGQTEPDRSPSHQAAAT
jgi:AraC family transcriptional regulator, regulatory protein of adaptative response / DNA-3-methyladenine glycosylase II